MPIKLSAAPVKANAEQDVGAVQEGNARYCTGTSGRSLDWLNRNHARGGGGIRGAVIRADNETR